MWYRVINKYNSIKLISNTHAFKIILSLIFIFSATLTALTISSADVSAKTNNQMKVSEQSMTYLYYNSLTLCADKWKLSKTNAGLNKLELSDANNFNWFENEVFASNKTEAEVLNSQGIAIADGNLNFICGNNGNVPWISDAITSSDYWGYANGLDAVCEFGLKRWKRNVIPSQEVDCKSGKDVNEKSSEDDLLAQANLSGKMDVPTMKKSLTDRMGSEIKLTDPIKYKLYLNAFKKSCAGNEVTAEDGDKTYTITDVDLTTSKVTKKIFSAAKSPSQVVAFYYDISSSLGASPARTKSTCKEIANILSDNNLALAFSNQLDLNNKNPEVGKEEDGFGTPTQTDGTAEATCGSTVKGVGWIICPVLKGLIALNDGMWSLTSSLLKTNPLNQNDNIYKAWSAIRNIANVAFAIVFLIIIFSQISNIGVTNYGIKKLLPKIIVCAILVNVSFFLVQVMVDIANILGSSLFNVMNGLAKSSSSFNPDTGMGNVIFQFILHIAGGVATAGAGVFAVVFTFGGAEVLLWLLFPVLIMATLAFIAALFTLVFRTAMIPLLAILAPLAFVAYLLPNTESWFKKWKDMFIKMLMLYPLAAIVFGGCKLAAVITIGDGTNPDLGQLFIGYIIMALPLFSLPFLAKQGGDILNKVNGALMGLAEKVRNPLNDYSKGRRDLARSKYLANAPKNGVGFGFRKTAHRAFRNRNMRRVSRELDTETNNENFKSDWARNPNINEDGTKRTPTDKEEKNEKRNGAGYRAIARSLESKDLAESRKTSAQTNYLKSPNGITSQNNLGGVKAINEKAVLDTQHRVNAIHNDKLEDVDTAKLRNTNQEKRRQVRVNDSIEGRAHNENILKSDRKLNKISGEVEKKFASSKTGMALDDDINYTKLEIEDLALESNTRVATSVDGQRIKKSIMEHKEQLKTAEDDVATNYENDVNTLSTRLNSRVSKVALEKSQAATNQMVAEMTLRKKGADGRDSIDIILDENGRAQFNNDGSLVTGTQAAILPDVAGMVVPEGYNRNEDYLQAVARSLHDSNTELKVATAAEGSAKGLDEFRYHQDVADGKTVPNGSITLADASGSVGGLSQTGSFNKVAGSLSKIAKDSNDDSDAASVYFTVKGYGNKDNFSALTSGMLTDNKIINPAYEAMVAEADAEKAANVGLDEDMKVYDKQIELRNSIIPEYLPDPDSPKLTFDQRKALLKKAFASNHQPTIKRMLNWLTQPKSDPEEQEVSIKLLKEAADLGYSDTIFGGSARDKARSGDLDLNYTRLGMGAIKDKKWSSSVIVDSNDDKLESLFDVIQSTTGDLASYKSDADRGITGAQAKLDEQMEGRAKIYENIRAASNSSSMWGRATDLQIEKMHMIATAIEKQAATYGISLGPGINYDKKDTYENS